MRKSKYKNLIVIDKAGIEIVNFENPTVEEIELYEELNLDNRCYSKGESIVFDER